MQAKMFHGAEMRSRAGSLPYVWPLIATAIGSSNGAADFLTAEPKM
jgi:hypothetical protein